MQRIKNENLADPNACQICGEQPNGDFVIDTETYTPFAQLYQRNGRIYVCERCAQEIASRLGWESGDEVQKARKAADEARAELANVRERTTELAEHIRNFVSSPASLDPQASADALNAVFNQNDSASASALDPSKLANDTPPEDLVSVPQREEVDTSDPNAIQARVEPQTANGAGILENEQTAAKVDEFDGNINDNENAAVIPAEFLEVNQPVERTDNIAQDVIGAEDTPAGVNEDGTFKVNEESLKADEANAEAAIANADSTDTGDPLAGVSEDAVQAAKDASGDSNSEVSDSSQASNKSKDKRKKS